MGLQKSLHMTNQDYNNVAQMFCRLNKGGGGRWITINTHLVVGYLVFMPPGNILLRWISPHYQIGGAIICFGTLVAALGAAENYSTVLALRILIGAAQAFIQGTGLYGSLWWKRDEVATRGGKWHYPRGMILL
jgi:hypothetical protein